MVVKVYRALRALQFNSLYFLLLQIYIYLCLVYWNRLDLLYNPVSLMGIGALYVTFEYSESKDTGVGI